MATTAMLMWMSCHAWPTWQCLPDRAMLAARRSPPIPSGAGLRGVHRGALSTCCTVSQVFVFWMLKLALVRRLIAPLHIAGTVAVCHEKGCPSP